MDELCFKCRVDANQPGLHLLGQLDDKIFFNGDPFKANTCAVQLSDLDATHILKFTLSGKKPEHTKIDAYGNILEDIQVTISDLSFDDINLGYLFTEKSVYQHNFNDTGSESLHQFFGTMGCNGTVTFEFTTPFYLYLLENM